MSAIVFSLMFVLDYRTHNLWFRCVLLLEQLSNEQKIESLSDNVAYQSFPILSPQQEVGRI